MGLFSGIGNAIGGLVKAVVPGAATFFGGPVGSVIGSALGGALSFADQNVGPLIGGAAQYFSAQDVNKANSEMLDRQQSYNVTNAATANAFSERMAGLAFDRTRQLQSEQHQENRALTERSIAENREAQQRAIDFEREMSGTAYQRASADLRAAGLNPILLAHQPGASTPSAPVLSAPTGSASAGSVSAPHGASHSSSVIPRVEKWGPAIATAVQLARFEQDLRNARVQELSLLEDVHSKAAQSKLTTLQQETERKRTELVAAQARKEGRTAEDAERYGASTLGRNVGSAERILETLYRSVRGLGGDALRHFRKMFSNQYGSNMEFQDDDEIER